jgi:outer membrane protein assembly factor BamB
MRMSVGSLGLLALACFSSGILAEDWPCFRGPNGSAVSSETGLPLTWSDSKNIAWKAELPGPGSSGPSVLGDRVFVTCYSGYGVDRSNPGDQANLKRHVLCLKLDNGKVLWRQSAGSYVPSPVVVGGHVYWADERGMACCLKADTGQQVYRQRLPGAGSVYASTIAGDGKLYVVTRRNGTFVLPAEPKFKVLAQNRLESDSTDFTASPAVSHGRLLLRSNRFLYCIGTK